MQIISVEINQHKSSMKELCSKVPASVAGLGLVGGSGDDGSFWGGGVMRHLFPLLVGIKVEESTTVPSHHRSKSSLLIFYIWRKFRAYRCLRGATVVRRRFFLCCKAPGLLSVSKASLSGQSLPWLASRCFLFDVIVGENRDRSRSSILCYNIYFWDQELFLRSFIITSVLWLMFKSELEG